MHGHDKQLALTSIHLQGPRLGGVLNALKTNLILRGVVFSPAIQLKPTVKTACMQIQYYCLLAVSKEHADELVVQTVPIKNRAAMYTNVT